MPSNNIYTKTPGIKLTIEQFIERATVVHNGKFDYSKVEYINGTTKIIIICPIHGEFLQTPANHLVGKGCKKCASEKARLNKTSIEEFIQKSQLIHGNIYDYSKVEYINCDTKVIIICPIHGEFLQTPYHHINRKCKCRKCAIPLINSDKKLTHEEFINYAKQTHGDKYNYSESHYINVNTKIKIICKYHGEFWQTPGNHIYNQKGCKKCTSKVSKPSQKWLNSLNLPNLIREYPLPEYTRRHVDGYDPETNTVYQFHGSYWHSDPRIHNLDSIHETRKITHGENYAQSCEKDQQIIDWGYNLVIMWEYDWNNMKRDNQ